MSGNGNLEGRRLLRRLFSLLTHEIAAQRSAQSDSHPASRRVPGMRLGFGCDLEW